MTHIKSLLVSLLDAVLGGLLLCGMVATLMLFRHPFHVCLLRFARAGVDQINDPEEHRYHTAQ